MRVTDRLREAFRRSQGECPNCEKMAQALDWYYNTNQELGHIIETYEQILTDAQNTQETLINQNTQLLNLLGMPTPTEDDDTLHLN